MWTWWSVKPVQTGLDFSYIYRRQVVTGCQRSFCRRRRRRERTETWRRRRDRDLLFRQMFWHQAGKISRNYTFFFFFLMSCYLFHWHESCRTPAVRTQSWWWEDWLSPPTCRVLTKHWTHQQWSAAHWCSPLMQPTADVSCGVDAPHTEASIVHFDTFLL